MKYNIWDADVDHLPEGLIGALTTDLVLDAWGKSATNSSRELFTLPLGNDFIAFARVEPRENNCVVGGINIFKIEELGSRRANTPFDEYRPIAIVTFDVDEDIHLTPDDILLSSSCLVRDETASPEILNALIIATGAKKIVI